MELGRVKVTFVKKAILFSEGDQKVPIKVANFLNFKKALKVLYTSSKPRYLGKVYNISVDTIIYFRVISFKLSDSDCHIDFYHHYIPNLCQGIIDHVVLCLELGNFERVLLENLKNAMIKLCEKDRKEMLIEIRSGNAFFIQRVAEETIRNSKLK